MLQRVIDEAVHALLLMGAAWCVCVSYGLAALLVVACLWEMMK